MEKDTRLLKLQSLCVKREYCLKDIYAKALRLAQDAADPQAEAQRLVDALVRDSFVSDARYSAAFAREKSSLTGWGPHKISAALRAKGIDGQTIKNALECVDGSAADTRMAKVIQSRWRALRDDPQGKLKLIRFALGRGYDYEAVASVIRELEQ